MAAAEIRQDVMANPWTYGAMAAECLPLGIGTTVSVAHAGYDVSTGTRTLARAGRDLAIDAAIGYVGGKTVAGLAKGGAFVAARVSAKVASRAAAKTAVRVAENIPFPKKAAQVAGEADISVAKILGPKPKAAVPSSTEVIEQSSGIEQNSKRIANKNKGRTGRQAKLKELSTDLKLGKSDRGWLKQEANEVKLGKKSHMRNPPGKDLAHKRGYEASKGFDYKYSQLQEKKLHRLQHKYDGFGKKNTTPTLDE